MRPSPLCRAMGLSVVCLALVLSGTAQAVSISLVPSAPSFMLGEQAELELRIDGLGNGVAPSLGGWQLDVLYSPELAFDSVAFGATLGDEALFESFSSFTPGAGEVALIQVSFLSPGALDALQGDSLVLATLLFDTVAEGSALLEIQNALASDAEFPPGNIGLDPSDVVTFEVTEAIPEPDALLLFAYAWGIVGLSLRRRL